MQDVGLGLRIEKCFIGVKKVSYLGYLIDKDGLHPTDEKIEGIKNAPVPTNVIQLKAYLGLLSFYRRFLPSSASTLEPLHALLRNKTPWRWGKIEENAFLQSKQLLLNSRTLIHFDPSFPIVVVADSSTYGIGAVLCHLIGGVERPIYFASRTLTATESNYAQIEKEALAIVFALRKFHYYLWGQNFTVVTDHKPLLGLFDAGKSITPMASGRIQRWSLMLQAYKFVLKQRSVALLGTADALSRLPLQSPDETTPIPAEWSTLVNFLDAAPLNNSQVKSSTRTDPTLSKVYRFCADGWPTVALADPDLTPHYRRRTELSIQDGCVLWGSRVVIPNDLRSSLFDELHSGHAGLSRIKELARNYLWWHNLDRDLEELTRSCPECLTYRVAPPKAVLHPWEWPTRPWHRIHIDYAGPVHGRYFLLLWMHILSGWRFFLHLPLHHVKLFPVSDIILLFLDSLLRLFQTMLPLLLRLNFSHL